MDNRQSFKNWENIKNENETESAEASSSKAAPSMLRLPYALAKQKGLSTEGMTPRQVWEMLKGKGIDKATEQKKFIDSQKVNIKQNPQDELEQFFEDNTNKIKQEIKKNIISNFGAYKWDKLAKTISTQIGADVGEVQKIMDEIDFSGDKDFDNPNLSDSIDKIKLAQTKKKYPLEGSEKQIEWAENIRGSKLPQMRKAADKGERKLKQIEAIANEGKAESIAKYGEEAVNRLITVEKQNAQSLVEKYKRALTEKSARWWIDNR